MITFFKKLLGRGDVMMPADKWYYKKVFRTTFWSLFSLIVIAWVGTNLVLCALSTNVVSGGDIIYEAPEPASLPIGKEVNRLIRNRAEYTEDSNTDNWKVKSITFDKFTGGVEGVYDDASGKNLLDGAERVPLNVDEEIVLYRANSGADLYILSNKDIYANADSSCMFRGLSGCQTITFKNFNVSEVQNMSYMFAGGINGMDGYSSQGFKKLDLSDWDTGKVTDMSYMFYNCSSLSEINFAGWDTSNVATMEEMFGCEGFASLYFKELDVSSFDTRSCTNMINMFCSGYYQPGEIETIYTSDRFVVDQANCAGMFYYCYSLVGGQGTPYNSNNDYKTYARIDGKDGLPGYFTEKPYSGR